MFLHPDDIDMAHEGIRPDGQRVDLTSHFAEMTDGAPARKRHVDGFRVRAYDLPRRLCDDLLPRSEPRSSRSTQFADRELHAGLQERS